MKNSIISLAVAVALTSSVPSLAQQNNLEKLSDFRTTGASLEIETVSQEGKRADNLRAIAEKINLPPGFKIDLFAVVPDARHMAVGNNASVVFVGTRKNRVWAVTDRDYDRVADETKVFAPSLDFKVPNGVCMSKDGFLFVAEHNRVIIFPAAEFFYESPDVAAFLVAGQLIPTEEESYNHGARVCRIGPDNNLYIALGQPYNVFPPEKMDLYNEVGIGGIIRMTRDGKDRKVIATGIRNSVGMDFNPANGQLWFTDNQVDGMGDDIPPGEINRLVSEGQRFGFPWYGGGDTRTNEYMDDDPPAGLIFPEVETVAHGADLGMTFYNGDMFPGKYSGGIFTAQHGSWNRTTPVGARVIFTAINADGSAGETEVFADGWIDANNEYLGRPVDVAQYLDGSLLVSDDKAGAIYRIWYEGI